MHPRWKTNLQTRERKNKTIILNFWRKIEKQMLPRDSVDTSRMPIEKKNYETCISVPQASASRVINSSLVVV